ncbi:MAG: hypothetical protein RL758_2354 [Pseudomonadota bacterium]|jgi:hypothetical protein
MKTRYLAGALVMAMMGAAATAQTIGGLSVDKSQVQVGQSVTATVRFDSDGGYNCGLRFYWGDGVTQDIKVLEASQNPLVLRHTYSKPGQYALMAEGKKVTSHLKCQGANARATVGVTPPPPPAAKPAAASPSSAAAAPAPAGPSPCPTGWKLDAKSVNKKTGAYTCSAKAGTPAPAAKLSCTGDSGYFENPKKGQIGCKP